MFPSAKREQIIALIKREVVPAIGCTEPVAVALCVAHACEVAGCSGETMPDAIEVKLSANILKNAMGVGIPGTGMIGLPIAIALGAMVGRSEYELEVLKDANGKDQMKLTGANGTYLFEKTGEAQPAIADSKYNYLNYPVTVIDDESGMRMTLRLFCNGHMMLDSYQMNYEFDADKGVISIKNQGNTVFQITIISETEWEFGVEGAGSSRRQVIITKR